MVCVVCRVEIPTFTGADVPVETLDGEALCGSCDIREHRKRVVMATIPAILDDSEAW